MKNHVPVEDVACPICQGRESKPAAVGPDYDCHSCGDQEFAMVRCARCETFYLNPRPAVAALPQIYSSDDYYSYDFAEEGNPVVLRARLQRNIQKAKRVSEVLQSPVAEAKVLDIGAGDGALLEAFASCGYGSQHLYGSELDDAAVRKIGAKGYHGLCIRAEEMNFEPGTFDVVTMIQVIEHVAAPRELVAKLHAMMRPGGILCIETPNMDGWDRPFFSRRTWGGYHFPRHWTMWDPKTMRHLLDGCGFDVLSITTLPAAVIWVWSFNHVLQDVFGNGRIARFFSMNNPLSLGVFWFLEWIPARMGKSSNMRIIARRRA